MSKDEYCGDCFYWMQGSGKWVVLKNCSRGCDCKNEPYPAHQSGHIEISLCTKGRRKKHGMGFVFPINQAVPKAAVCYINDGEDSEETWFYKGNQNTIQNDQLAAEWRKFAKRFPTSNLVLVFGDSLVNLVGIGNLFVNDNPRFFDEADHSVELQEEPSVPRTAPKSPEKSGGRKKQA